MKRRGFLGFLAGGAVAGPGMVRDAAAQATADMSSLSLGRVAGGLPMTAQSMGAIGSVGPRLDSNWAHQALAKLAGKTAERIAWEKKQVRVFELDPDLATYRSLALHAKISIQRERDYQRSQEQEREHLMKTISGWFD